jgi:hypothetical protein
MMKKGEMSEAATAAPVLDTSPKALHLCLKPIKDAKNENELRRLTEELQGIVFHRQYQNAGIRKPPPYFMKGAPVGMSLYTVPLLSKTGTNLATRVANGGLACPELEF